MKNSANFFAYIGCRTTKERNARGKGISLYTWNEGQWTYQDCFTGLTNPSYQCFDRTGDFLYTVHGDYSEASAFRRDQETGRLTLLNTVSTHGTNPVFILPDESNQFILVANLQSGNIVAFRRNEDGSLGDITDEAYLSGLTKGAVSHPHQLYWDHTWKWLFVPAQGRKAGVSKICTFTFNSSAGTFTLYEETATATLSEARHVVLHPNNQWLYLMNEAASTITQYSFNASQGSLTEEKTISSLPADYTGPGQASGIITDQDGKFLFISNRKHDSVASFHIDPVSGELTPICWRSTQGKTPRFITLAPTGDYLIAANEESDTLISFRIEADGQLTEAGPLLETPSPVCVTFSK